MQKQACRPSSWTRHLLLLAALSALLVVAACSVENSVREQQPTKPCTLSKDCPLGMICNGAKLCESPTADGDLIYCVNGDECPIGQFCDNGVCVPPAQPDGDELESEADTSEGSDAEPDSDAETAIVPGELTVPGSVDFPPLMKDESEVREVVLKASEAGPVTISKFALAERTSPDYTLQNAPTALPFVIEAGKSVTFSVKYLQSNAGFDSGALEIESDSVSALKKTVELRVKTSGSPGIQCTPETLPFGVVPINGATTSLSVVCKNVRRQAGDDNLLQISSLTFDPAPNPHYSLDAALSTGLYLRSDHQATFTVAFAPAAAGEQDATLKIMHNAPDIPSPLVISLTGKGGQRLLTPDRTAIHFGEARIGAVHREHLILTANGDMAVTISAITVKSGSNPSPFSIDLGTLLADGPKVLAPNETAAFDVLFSPSQKPGVSGTVEITTDIAGSPLLSVPLDGSGTTFFVTSNPGTADFGAVALGKSKTIDLSLINSGGQMALFKQAFVTGPEGVFTLTPVETPFAIIINGSKVIHLTFTPPSTAETSYQGSLVFVVDDAQETHVTIPILGTGALPHLTLDPLDAGVHDFGPSVLGTSKKFTYLVKNTGLVPLTLGSMAFLTNSGDPNGTFKASFEGNTVIEPAQQRNLVFTFDLSNTSLVPSALPLAATRDYVITSDDPQAGSLSITLKGLIVAPVAKLNVTGSLYDFGKTPPDCDAEPLLLTLTNVGSGPLRVTDIHLVSDYQSDFRLSDLPVLPLFIQPASASPENPESISFSVYFSPTATLSRNATLYVVNEGYGTSNLSLALRGKGTVCGDNDSSGTHECGCRCVDNSSPEHCGTSACVPCASPTHGHATCTAINTTYSCGINCDEHFLPTAGKCVPENTLRCCGESCVDCSNPMLYLPPESGVAICDKTSSSCSFTCLPGTHRDEDTGTLCLKNNVPAHCGISNRDCTKISMEGKHAEPACDEVHDACSLTCWEGYKDCSGGGISGDGCEINASNDINHCGDCTTACPSKNNTPVCLNGNCTVGECKKGFGDCDGFPGTGCEIDLTRDITHCGVCDVPCSVVNGTPGCDSGKCVIASCNASFRDCDKNVSTGCESDSLRDDKNCGYCGNECVYPNAEAHCVAGTCTIAATGCASGFKDCDGVIGNGCEINIYSSLTNCGACDRLCAPPHAIPACASGLCSIGQCKFGYKDCNDDLGDGCETYTGNDVNNCGGCGNIDSRFHCSYPNARAVCTNSTCGMGECLPGFYDVDGRTDNGCEANSQSDPNACGELLEHCTTPLNTYPARCVDGVCKAGSCLPGYTNCDAGGACGIQLATDINNCGGCGNRCLITNGGGMCAGGFCLIDTCNMGYQDCNKIDIDGCEVRIGDDAANCGGCGLACDLPHVSKHLCAVGKCKISTCDEGYADCDGVVENGCEQNIVNDPNYCGSCTHACNFAFGSGICTHGDCQVTSCENGFGNCEIVGNNGCESKLNTDKNTCGSFERMLKFGGGDSISGDSGSDRTKDYTDWGNKWFRVYITEDDSSLLSPRDLTANFILEVPPGTDYDLYLYRDESCSAVVARSSSSVLGQFESIKITEDDNQGFGGIGGHDDGFWVNVEVRFYNGSGCEPWTLRVLGNTN